MMAMDAASLRSLKPRSMAPTRVRKIPACAAAPSRISASFTSNKAAIKQTFAHLPKNSKLVLDASDSIYIDHDVLLLIKEFVEHGSKEKNIEVKLMGFRKEYKIENTDVYVTTVLSDNDAPVSPNEVTSGVKASSNAVKVKDLSTDTDA